MVETLRLSEKDKEYKGVEKITLGEISIVPENEKKYVGLLEQKAMGKEKVPFLDTEIKEGPGGKALGWFGKQLVGGVDATLSLVSGMALWPFSKAYGIMALPFGEETARIAEQEMMNLGYKPQTKEGQEAVEAISKGFELFLMPAHMAGEATKKVSPRLSYLVELGGELAEFAMTGGVTKGIKAGLKKPGPGEPGWRTSKGMAEEARKTELQERLETSEAGRPLESLRKAEEQLLYEKSKIGQPLLKPKEFIGETYRKPTIETRIWEGKEPVYIKTKAEIAKEKWEAEKEIAQKPAESKIGRPLLKPEEAIGETYRPEMIKPRRIEVETIPQFMSTNEAVAFGRKATAKQATLLKRNHEKSVSEFSEIKEKALKATGEQKRVLLQQMADKAVESQFYREAHEAYKGADYLKDIPSDISFEFGGLQTVYETAFKKLSGRLKKEKKQKGTLSKEEEVIFDRGEIVKQRQWKSNGIQMKAPPVYKVEKDIVRNMNELRNKPLKGWLETPIRTMEELGVEAKELFYRPIKEAEHKVALERMATRKEIAEMKKGVSVKSRKRIGAYAIAQQKRGTDILAEMGIKEVPKLTKKEQALYDSLRNKFEEYYLRLNEARMVSGKDPFPKVENYFTFFRELGFLEKLGWNPVFTKATDLNAQFIHMKTTPFRYAKPRAKEGNWPVDIDAFSIFEKYSDPAIKHIHMSPPIAKGREMLLTFGSKKKGDRWILKENKPNTAKFLSEWLDFQAGQKPPTNIPPLIDKALMRLNKNLTFSILSGNIRSALIQPTAIKNTAIEIGPKYTMEGIYSLFSPEMRNFAMEKSNVLLSRNYDVAVQDFMESLSRRKLGKLQEGIGRAGLKPLQLLDMETAKATWYGAYKKGKSLGYSEKKSINYADDVVTKTQASAAPSDIAPIQRTALGKSLSLFQTFVINEWNFITKDVFGIKNASMKNPETVKKVIGFIAGTTLVNIFYEDVIGVYSPYPTPIKAFMEAIENGEEFPSATLKTAKELSELMPIIGGGLRYGKGITGAGLETIRSLIEGKKPVEEGLKMMGIPGISQAAKTKRAIKRDAPLKEKILGSSPKKKKEYSNALDAFGSLSGGF